MAQGAGTKHQSDYEYSLEDLHIVAFNDAAKIFDFADCVEDIAYGNAGDSKMIQGSKGFPRAHTRILYKPGCEMTMDYDTATRLVDKFSAGKPIRLVITRQTPDGKAVTDGVLSWLPIKDNPSFKAGDGAMVKVKGNARKVELDVKHALTA